MKVELISIDKGIPYANNSYENEANIAKIVSSEISGLTGGNRRSALLEDKINDDKISGLLEDELEVVTQPGDLWILGKQHRLLCADTTNADSIKQVLCGDIADMIFTDPPYNVNYVNNMGDKIQNDNLAAELFYKFLLSACGNMLKFCTGAIYISMSVSELHTLRRAFVDAGGHWSNFIIWAKNHFTLSRADYHRQYEPILYGWAKGSKRYWCGDRKQSDIWNIARSGSNKLHPTMKPVELVERAVTNSSSIGDIILDPFAGSGATLIACENLGRKARLIEIEPKYCDVMIKRWQTYTGQKGIKLLKNLNFN